MIVSGSALLVPQGSTDTPRNAMSFTEGDCTGCPKSYALRWGVRKRNAIRATRAGPRRIILPDPSRISRPDRVGDGMAHGRWVRVGNRRDCHLPLCPAGGDHAWTDGAPTAGSIFLPVPPSPGRRRVPRRRGGPVVPREAASRTCRWTLPWGCWTGSTRT